MASLGWITERLCFAVGRFRPLKIGPLRFLAILLATVFLTPLVPHSLHDHDTKFGLLPVYGQTVVTNQAGGSFSNGTTTVNVQSNQTTISTPASPAVTIVKTADRGAAEPGDVVTYRLVITNPTTVAATNVTVTDQLPLGVQLIENAFAFSPTQPTSTTVSGRTFTLQFATINGGESLTIVYSAEITGDALRGSGRNLAQVSIPGVGTFSASFQLLIRPGILSDCGTIVGRVFVDKNFDGEQQPGEPGVPNAIIFMDDGNRIITDADGLFSLINVLSGNRVGTLDLSSLPGYTLAPNLYWLADNSVSRLTRLEPGGLARMNFAVTPTFGEGQS